jgi:hypothetical protein
VAPAKEQHPRELERRLAASVGVGHAVERFSQVVGGARCEDLPLGAAQPAQQVDALLGRRRLVQRAAQVGHGDVGRLPRQRLAGGVLQRFYDEALGSRSGQQQLRRDLFAGCAACREQGRAPGVFPVPLRGCEPAIDCGAHDRVHERQRKGWTQQLGTAQRCRGLDGRRGIQGRQRGGVPQVDVVAENRDGARERRRLRPERVQPQADRAHDPARSDVPNAGGGVRDW